MKKIENELYGKQLVQDLLNKQIENLIFENNLLKEKHKNLIIEKKQY